MALIRHPLRVLYPKSFDGRYCYNWQVKVKILLGNLRFYGFRVQTFSTSSLWNWRIGRVGRMRDLRVPHPIQSGGGSWDREKFGRGDITIGIQGGNGKAGDDAIWGKAYGNWWGIIHMRTGKCEGANKWNILVWPCIKQLRFIWVVCYQSIFHNNYSNTYHFNKWPSWRCLNWCTKNFNRCNRWLRNQHDTRYQQDLQEDSK